MPNAETVGEFNFGCGTISADRTGVFTLALPLSGTKWQFDVGEISSLDRILLRIEGKTIEPTEEKPEVFWRTNGTRVMEVYLGQACFRRYDFIDSFFINLGLMRIDNQDSVFIREGGTTIGCIPRTEIQILRRHIRVLTENAPYPRAVQLVDVNEEKRNEHLIRIERFPLNNRNSKTSLKVEREFRQEIVKTLNIEASFGIGLDYYIKANLETKYGLAREQRLSESIKVSMEAEPGEHKEYVISWKEVTTIGYAVFDVNGVREKVPFELKSGLIPDVRQEAIAHD